MKESENIARAWLRQATIDLDFAQNALDNEFYSQACFNSQQVAEKALKALSYRRGDRFVTGHSLVNLARSLENSYPQILEYMRAIRRLNLYYIATRYPDALAGSVPSDCFDREQAEEALALAEDIMSFAQSIIPQN